MANLNYQNREFNEREDSTRLACRHTALTPIWVHDHAAGDRKGELHGSIFKCGNCGVELRVERLYTALKGNSK